MMSCHKTFCALTPTFSLLSLLLLAQDLVGVPCDYDECCDDDDDVCGCGYGYGYSCVVGDII